MSEIPKCPDCGSEHAYEDRNMYVCPECGHEWGKGLSSEGAAEELVVGDSNGNRLRNGDTIAVITDLKVKGPSSVVKIGPRVKNIRLVEGGHDIGCNIVGIGTAKLM